MACNFGRTGDRFINFYPLGLCHMQQRRGTGVWFIHCLRIDFVGVMLLTNVIGLIAWETAPETTANQYIVEHYGGTEK